MDTSISFKLKVWRQANAHAEGRFETYEMRDIPTDTSFLEMMDILNEQLIEKGEEPVTFDHDCREGICGMCSLYVNGHPHGPATGATTCQLYMRRFKDGQQAGGYVSFQTGGAQDANAIPISKEAADEAMDSATCIGCGACVAACKNGSAMLFLSAKVSQFALLPQGRAEAKRRVKAMLAKMDELGFGNCTNTGACAAECPKNIKLSNIARLNREFICAKCSD